MLLRVTLLASALIPPLVFVHSATAQDASFGCKVLLCAAATAPSWSGIPYCVPVMQQLFKQLAKGGSWPNCAQAHASPIGYQPYRKYPAADRPIATTHTDGAGRGGVDAGSSYSANASGGFCGRPTKIRTGNAAGSVGAYVGGIGTVTSERTDATALTGGPSAERPPGQSHPLLGRHPDRERRVAVLFQPCRLIVMPAAQRG
jgi:hypothetical protein